MKLSGLVTAALAGIALPGLVLPTPRRPAEPRLMQRKGEDKKPRAGSIPGGLRRKRAAGIVSLSGV